MKPLGSTLLIFDLDGTLVDSAGDITNAANSLLAALGRAPLPVDAVRGMVGEGARRLVERLLIARPGSDISVDSALEKFLALYAVQPTSHAALYPGVIETLDHLATQGAAMALCTNKPGIPTNNVLRDLGLSHYFGAVIAGDTLAIRKPDGRVLDSIIAAFGTGRDDIILVGDSEIDSATAAAAGIPFILMTYGYHHQPPDSIPAMFRLDRFSELIPLLPLAAGDSARRDYHAPQQSL